VLKSYPRLREPTFLYCQKLADRAIDASDSSTAMESVFFNLNLAFIESGSLLISAKCPNDFSLSAECHFNGSVAPGSGGAISTFGVESILGHCEFHNYSASFDGGAILAIDCFCLLVTAMLTIQSFIKGCDLRKDVTPIDPIFWNRMLILPSWNVAESDVAVL
jgi:hypothetical protein